MKVTLARVWLVVSGLYLLAAFASPAALAQSDLEWLNARKDYLISSLKLRDLTTPKGRDRTVCFSGMVSLGVCGVEYHVCRHWVGDNPESTFSEMPAFRKCARNLWKYVRAGQWDAVYNLTEEGSKHPVELLDPGQPDAAPVAGGQAIQSDGYSDIDELSTDDIDIMEVRKPPPKPRQQQKYCGCMFDHSEIYGFCRDDASLRATRKLFGQEMYDQNGNVKKGYGSGMYDTGYYPWTAECKMTVFR